MKYQYWLSNVTGIGNRTIERLRQVCESAEEIYFLTKEQLIKSGVVTEKEAELIQAGKVNWDLDENYTRLLESGITFYSQEMEAFPSCVRNIVDAPYSFYVKGKMPDFSKRRIAIVGARRCSEYGRFMSLELGKRLASCGVQIISGLASGIDSYGHRGALNGMGETFAVLGCGVDICYPESNRQLYEEILKKGGIISEYAPKQAPLARLFPARNRIISALSDIIIVIEAKERSGSLITADFALEQGKDVYAVPGRITDNLSKGCNNLIRQGAGIVTSVEEFMKDLEICTINEGFQENFNKLLLEKDESLVYSCLDLRPMSIEVLVRKTALKPAELADVLQRLVEKEFIVETFKNFYIRKI